MDVDALLLSWHGQLLALVNSVADTTRVLAEARSAVPISSSWHGHAIDKANDGMASILRRVRDANQLGAQLCALDPTLSTTVEPLLSVPGERPSVDLRPWWNRVLQRFSGTASQATGMEQLETLRLEADAAVMRAAGQLLARDKTRASS